MKMLLDPLEEQFHLPAPVVEFGDGQRVEREVVRQEREALSGLLVEKANAAQLLGVVAVRVETAKDDGLIASQSRGLVHGTRVEAPAIEVLLGPRDKERARLA